MKNNSLSPLLWIISSIISVSLFLAIEIGPWLFAEFAVVSILALICWLRFSFKKLPSQNNITPLYIIVITLFLILSTIRFSSNYASFLQNNMHYLFNTGFAVNHTSWFLLMVCFPVSTLLIGGYLLAGRHPAGFFFAWWGFFFCIAECLLQFKIEMGSLHFYAHQYFLGLLVASALFLLCVNGIMKMVNPVLIHQPLAKFDEPAQRKINLWSALFVTLVIIYGIMLYSQAGLLPVGVIAGSMMGGMMGWRKTTARFPADPYKVVPLYLLLQALFYIHVGEETLTHFNRGIASISGHAWDDKEFSYLIAFIGPVIWIFAGWSLWKGQAFGNFILWFLIVGMILGEPTHILVFPIARMVKYGVGYGYFSGMYTALFPMIPAILALAIIIKDHKNRNAANA